MTTVINLIFGIIITAVSHPLHVSFTNIEFNDSTGMWDLSVKLFKDDFGNELQKLYDLESNIIDIEDEGMEEFYREYLTENMQIIFDGKEILSGDWQYKKISENFEAVWIDYSFEAEPDPSKVLIINRLMFGMFNDQKNLLIFTKGEIQKAYQFKKNKERIELDLT